MLSRAVEGQLNEQRELMSAISDMRTQLMRFGQELAELRVRPPQDEASDATINNVTVEMREAVRFLSERLDGVTRVVAQRGEELGDIRTALTAIDAHARSQAETLSVLSAGLQLLPSYGERVSALQENVQVLHGQLTSIEGALQAAGDDKVDERLAAIDESLAPLTARLDAIDESLAPLTVGLDQVTDAESAQSGLLTQLQATTSGLHQAVTDLNAGLEPMASDITAIGGEVTGLVEGAADGAAMDARVTESVRAAVRGLEQRLTDHVDQAVLALAETLLRRRPSAAAGGHGPSAEQAEAAPPYGAEPAEPSPYGSASAEPVAAPEWSPPPAWAAADDLDADEDDLEAELDEPDAVGFGDEDIVVDDLDVSDEVDGVDDGEDSDDDAGADDGANGYAATDPAFTEPASTEPTNAELTGAEPAGAAGAADEDFTPSAWWERDVTALGDDSEDDTAAELDEESRHTAAAGDPVFGGDVTPSAEHDYWAKPLPDDLDRTGEISPTPLESWTPQTPPEPGAGEAAETPAAQETPEVADADGSDESAESAESAEPKRKRRWRRH
jgi:hypothetical protein